MLFMLEYDVMDISSQASLLLCIAIQDQYIVHNRHGVDVDYGRRIYV